MSAGPQGQSKATHGTPHAMASTIIMPNPSYLEDIAQMEAPRYAAMISLVGGCSTKLSSSPAARIAVLSLPLSRSAPNRSSLQSGNFPCTLFQASSKAP